jgi:hypothetical protein
VAHRVEVRDPLQPGPYLLPGIRCRAALLLPELVRDDLAQVGRAEGVEDGEQLLAPGEEGILADELAARVVVMSHGVTPA